MMPHSHAIVLRPGGRTPVRPSGFPVLCFSDRYENHSASTSTFLSGRRPETYEENTKMQSCGQVDGHRSVRLAFLSLVFLTDTKIILLHLRGFYLAAGRKHMKKIRKCNPATRWTDAGPSTWLSCPLFFRQIRKSFCFTFDVFIWPQAGNI